MTAFDNIKTNNWPATSNDFEDFLVLKMPLNDTASFTESLPVSAGSQELFPKRTLTNSGGLSMQYARVQPDYGATGFTKSTNWRTDYANPEVGIFNGDGTSTQAAVEGDNVEHWFAFATPLTNVTKVETRMGHDGNQSARAYMGNGTTSYASTAAHATYFTVYSGAATTFSKIGWRSNNGSGASVYDIRITDDNGTYVLVNNQNKKKHYDNNARFTAGGSGTVITYDADTREALKFGTGDFTVEAWVKKEQTDATSGGNACILEIGDHFTNTGVIFWASQSDTKAYSNTGYGSGGALTLGQWHHVAWSRTNGTLRVFRDGQQTSSVAFGNNLTDIQYATTGKSSRSTSESYQFNGDIQDLRVYKGVGKYTSNFTPPSAILG